MCAPIDGDAAVNSAGFCLSHPAIQVRKRRRNGGWMTLLSACPLCQIRDDEEASLSDRALGSRRRAESHLGSDGGGSTDGSDLGSALSVSSPTMGSGRRTGLSQDSRYTHPRHVGRKCLHPPPPPPPPPPQPDRATFLEPRRPALATTTAAATTTTTPAASEEVRARRDRIPKCAAFDYSISDLEPSTRAHQPDPLRVPPPPPPAPSVGTCKSADFRGRRKLISLLADHHDGGCQSADSRVRRKALSDLDGAREGGRRAARAREGVDGARDDEADENDDSNTTRTASLCRLVHGRRAQLDELKARMPVPPSQRYGDESINEERAGESAPPPPPPPPPPQRNARQQGAPSPSFHSASTRRADNTRPHPPPPRPPRALSISDASISVASSLTGGSAVVRAGSLDVSYDSFLRDGVPDGSAAGPPEDGRLPEPARRLTSIPDVEESEVDRSESSASATSSEDLSLTSRWEEDGAVEVTEHRIARPRIGRLRRRLRRVSSAGELLSGGSDETILDGSDYTFATDGSRGAGGTEDAEKECEERGGAADPLATSDQQRGDDDASDSSDEEASCCGSISLSSSGSEASSFLAGDGRGTALPPQAAARLREAAEAVRAVRENSARLARDGACSSEEQQISLTSTEAQAPGGPYSSATRSCRDPPTGRHQRRHSQGSCSAAASSVMESSSSRSSSCSPHLRGILRKAFGDGDDGTCATDSMTEPSTASTARSYPPRGILRPSSHLRSSTCSSTVSSLDDNCSASTASTTVFSYPSTDYSYSSSDSSSGSGGSSRGGLFPGGILRRGGSRGSGRSGSSSSGGSRVCFAGRDHIIPGKLVQFCEDQ